MTTPRTARLAVDAVTRLATLWTSVSTAEAVAEVMTCAETDALADVLRAGGAPDTADSWIAEHSATDEECRGHDTATAPAEDDAPSTDDDKSQVDVVGDLAEGARPAWKLYAATHQGVTIANLITDLLHLADQLPAEQDKGADDIVARALRDYGEERP